MALQRFDFAGKAPAFVALHHPYDLGEFGLIPIFPRCLPAVRTLLLPVMHVEPLDVTDTGRRLHFRLALDKDGLDVPALDANGDGDFIEADARVAGGVFREERQDAIAASMPSVIARRQSSPNLISLLSNQTSCPRFSGRL